MVKRGRKSTADLTTVEGGFGKRPEPPQDLNDIEKDIWRETAACEASNFFNTKALKDMLKDYCRHRSSSDMISETIRIYQADWLKNADGARRYAGLIKMRDLESRAAADKATKMRLTNQARYTPQAATTANKNTAIVKPWEI